MPGVYLEMGQGTERSGEVVKFGGTRLLLGRARRCDVQIHSDAASREHAALRLTGEGWVLEDLDSRNGTWLNNTRIGRAKISPLDNVRFGPSGPTIRIVSLDPPPAVAVHTDATQEAIVIISPLDHGKVWGMILSIVGLLLGAAFGVLTVQHIWPAAFPYADVLAPVTWLTAQIGKIEALAKPEVLPWIVRGLGALWFGVVGLALAKVWKRWWLLIVMVALHAGAWFLVNRG